VGTRTLSATGLVLSVLLGYSAPSFAHQIPVEARQPANSNLLRSEREDLLNHISDDIQPADRRFADCVLQAARSGDKAAIADCFPPADRAKYMSASMSCAPQARVDGLRLRSVPTVDSQRLNAGARRHEMPRPHDGSLANGKQPLRGQNPRAAHRGRFCPWSAAVPFESRFHAEWKEGYGSGPELLIVAPNAEPPHALVNLGRGNLKLSPVKPIAFPMFHCEVGERFVSEWKSETLRVLAKLSVVGSGDEACWFQGTVLATVEPKSSEVPVKGACGC
jgi:hypothetical protein